VRGIDGAASSAACAPADALAGLRAVRQRVALDERHLLEVVGEYPRGQQTSHAAADDHGVTGAHE